jgi:hypothetical protein
MNAPKVPRDLFSAPPSLVWFMTEDAQESLRRASELVVTRSLWAFILAYASGLLLAALIAFRPISIFTWINAGLLLVMIVGGLFMLHLRKVHLDRLRWLDQGRLTDPF